jgi:hypothetical protein
MKTIQIPKEILASIDMLNALNGGRSQTTLKVARQQDGYEVLVKRPGVEADALQVDVTDGRLWLYQLRPVLGREDAEPDTLLPDLLGNLILPNDVDVDAISARYLGDQWRVFLPFNDMARGFQKHIEVEF